MPNSFSRFLSEEELIKVRELYLQSVDAAEDDEDDFDSDPPQARSTDSA